MTCESIRVVRKAVIPKVLACFQQENIGSRSFVWAEDRLKEADKQFREEWKLVLLSWAQVLEIMLPEHRHGVDLIPTLGLPVAAAVQRLRSLSMEEQGGSCWENIASHRGRDFSQTHVFLKYQDSRLAHLDGLHRLLAWTYFGIEGEVAAFVAGLELSQSRTS